MSSPSNYAGKSAYHGDVVANYDRDRQTERIWQIEQSFISDWAQADLVSGDRILDLPSGTGRFLAILLERGAQVTASDISADMLAQIRARFSKENFPRLDVQQADAEHLPFADGAFDYIVSWRLFHLLPSAVIPRVLGELKRVTRKTAIVQVFAVRPAGSRPSLWRRMKAPVGAMLRRIRRKSPGDSPWAHITSYSHEEHSLLAAFAAAGLRVCRTHTFEVDSSGLANRVYFLAPTTAGSASVP